MQKTRIPMRELTINNIFDNWMFDGGIFNSLYLNHKNDLVMWQGVNELENSPGILDLDYHANRGDKCASMLVLKLLTESGLDRANRKLIGDVIFMKFHNKWNRIFEAINLVYDPIENYNRIDETTTEESGKEKNISTFTDNLDYENKRDYEDNRNEKFNDSETLTGKEKNTFTDNLEYTDETAAGSSPRTTTSSKNAFGSDSFTPSDKVVQTGSESINHKIGDSNTQLNEKEYDNYKRTRKTEDEDGNTTRSEGTDSTKHLVDQNRNQQTTEDERSFEDRKTKVTFRGKGNIGILSSAELLLKEYDIREYMDYYKMMYRDVDSVISSGIFPRCEDFAMWTIYEPGGGGGEITGDYVKSVNGKTGIVTIEIPERYTLPAASSTVLGGVKAVAKTNAMTKEVGIDAGGKLWSEPGSGGGGIPGNYVQSVNGQTGVVTLIIPDPYDLPVATTEVLGGVKGEYSPNRMSDFNMFGGIVDTSGVLRTAIPYASDDQTGVVRAKPKTEEMTEEVGIDLEGHLWSKPGSGGGSGGTDWTERSFEINSADDIEKVFYGINASEIEIIARENFTGSGSVSSILSIKYDITNEDDTTFSITRASSTSASAYNKMAMDSFTKYGISYQIVCANSATTPQANATRTQYFIGNLYKKKIKNLTLKFTGAGTDSGTFKPKLLTVRYR